MRARQIKADVASKIGCHGNRPLSDHIIIVGLIGHSHPRLPILKIW